MNEIEPRKSRYPVERNSRIAGGVTGPIVANALFQLVSPNLMLHGAVWLTFTLCSLAEANTFDFVFVFHEN